MARDRAAERAERLRNGYVGTVGTRHGILKVALPDKRERIRARCPVADCPDAFHFTAAAMPRPRRRGERCDAELWPDSHASQPSRAL